MSSALQATRAPPLRDATPDAAAGLGAAADFGAALLHGLSQRPRRIAPKFFYDAEGSRLFEAICELPEYYPTRTELAILHRHAREMAECIGPDAEIVEFGAGCCAKIRVLLAALRAPRAYLPIDISADYLAEQARGLERAHPGLRVTPLAADFTEGDVVLPPPSGRRVGFFPGSSIGNFTPAEARRFLAMARALLQGGGLLIGVDLVKDPAVLHRAYNDAQGITAAFNKNLLARANRELGCDFDLSAFDHYAFYEPVQQRIEMHLVSARRQRVHVAGERFDFDIGQTLHTENSYKYSIDAFAALARAAGFVPAASWCDAGGLFSVHWLAAPPAGT